MGTQGTAKRTVRVGIMTKRQWRFALRRNGQTTDQTVELQEGKILYNGTLHNSLTFTDLESFTLYDVDFAKKFHFGLTETESFSGDLQFLVDAEGIVAINILPVEEYLKSVISSEMNADCPFELLKAHSVISRSWLIHNSQFTIRNSQPPTSDSATVQPPTSFIKWYERDAHLLFDVCADDHCQRYLGITRQLNPNVEKAVQETENEVLMYAGEVCDTRYHKCCGGKTEAFQYVWADTEVPYLQSVDCPYCGEATSVVLRLVLNDFDLNGKTSNPHCVHNPHSVLDTGSYYRWQVRYSQSELSELIKRKSGIDFGAILALEPIERGLSGRISKLKIVGTKKTLVVGKELEIRYWLADTCLYSSDFEVCIQDPANSDTELSSVAEKVALDTSAYPSSVVEKDMSKEKLFVLKGRGWGHGVGLCQIGAAVMAERGFDYRQILHHYFPKAELSQYSLS